MRDGGGWARWESGSGELSGSRYNLQVMSSRFSEKFKFEKEKSKVISRLFGLSTWKGALPLIET